MLLLFLWLLVIPTICGHIQKSEKITNGFDTSITKYPFQVALLYRDSFICGGSIVSEKIVITAAHCVNVGRGNHKYFKISVGSAVFKTGRIYSLSKIIIHPSYKPRKKMFDIAILKLATSLKFSNHVKPIEIQPLYSEVPDGTKAYVTGWGILKPNSFTAAKRLQAAEVCVISNERCEGIFNSSIYHELKFEDYYLCTIDQYRGACSGDSGGPLIANNKLIGVVSFGVKECDPPYPGVYVNVSYVRAFINLYI